LRKAVDVHVLGLREHFFRHLSRTELERLTTALEAILEGEGSARSQPLERDENQLALDRL
jgi:hypothetical protein